MKRIVPILLFLASFHACADAKIIASSPNKAGGTNYLLVDHERCNTGFGFMSVVPFVGNVRGCVTAFTPDYTAFHVFFENQQEEDYTVSNFTKVATAKTKGNL